MALRELVRSLLPGFVLRGYSANRTLELLRSAGLGYRRQDFLDDYREIRGQTLASNLRHLNYDARPNVARLPARFMGSPDRYSFIAQIQLEYHDGTVEKRYFTYHTDINRTRGELERDMLEHVITSPLVQETRSYRVMLVAGFRNPVYG